ncbi:MAG: UDP-N-acetylmuramate dehydrogenase [Candidatus Dactylopiibacterium sp.]|nr:UDP-N-acetylmuramate dehydrogenase [Candidatus Dactylopiibacterium sp.]
MPFAFQHDYTLSGLNTFGLPCVAQRYGEILSASQLTGLVRRGALADAPPLILGGGSNLLLPETLAATVLHIRIPGHALVGSDDDHHFVRAGAGENWHDFVRWTLEMGWPGLENLSLIPGTVGAAPVQNIGAYGLEIKDRFFALEAVDLRNGTIVTLDAADCRFAYRDSLFKHEGAGRFVITAVTFRLPKRWTPLTRYGELARELGARGLIDPSPLQVSDAVCAIRRRKLPDPARLGNAGSFFKNPVVSPAQFEMLRARFPEMPAYLQDDGRHKLAAGWLIEQAGWRGRSLGPVGMYEGQALVMVNQGGATRRDVEALADSVQRSVRERFDVTLEMEPVRP